MRCSVCGREIAGAPPGAVCPECHEILEESAYLAGGQGHTAGDVRAAGCAMMMVILAALVGLILWFIF